MGVLQLISRLLLALALSFVWLKTAQAQDPSSMVVGGKEVPAGKYPWQVRLYGSLEDPFGFCGGSIISDSWVLTAAHCVVNTDYAVVGYGSTDRAKTRKIESEKIIVHPDYLGGDNDVALIKLKTPIRNAPWVGIADKGVDRTLLTPGAKVTVSGWGAVWDDKVFQAYLDCMSVEECRTRGLKEILQKGVHKEDRGLKDDDELYFPRKLAEVEVEVISQQSCKSAYERLGPGWTISDGEVCAIEPSGGKDSCYGDSGGPLMVPAENLKGFVQVGVVSWGIQCGNPKFPGVYARVSSFHDWIQQTMGSE